MGKGKRFIPDVLRACMGATLRKLRGSFWRSLIMCYKELQVLVPQKEPGPFSTSEK